MSGGWSVRPSFAGRGDQRGEAWNEAHVKVDKERAHVPTHNLFLCCADAADVFVTRAGPFDDATAPMIGPQ